MRVKFYFLHLLLFILLAPTVNLKAQTQTLRPNANINANCNGYVEYLPQGYDPNGSTLYPLLVYLPGIEQSGNGNTDLTKLYDLGDGPPYWINQNINNLSSFTVNGTTFRFVMFTPQWIRSIVDANSYPTVDEINSVINYAVEHYKVDKSRIYLMGISTGGGSVWQYATAGAAYADRLAAIVPFSGTDTPTLAKAQILVNRQMPIWAFHNSADKGVPVYYTEGWKDSIKFLTNGNYYVPTPKFTIFQTTDSADHVSWWGPTEGTYSEDGLNVYQWMLQYTHTPAANQAPVANAGTARSIVFPNNSVQLQGSATDLDNYTLSYSWSQVSGPNTATISNGTTTSPTMSGLIVGTYVFRLTASDGSLQGTSDVSVTVEAAGSLTRIEAEDFSATNGVLIGTDAGSSNGKYVGWVDAGDWMDFPVNTLGGSFDFSFSISAPFPTTFTIMVGSTTLATVNVPNTGGSLNWQTITVPGINLPAGQQTLRIGAGNAGWNMDYFSFQATQQSSLPVKFVYFNSQCSNGTVQLRWKTAQELNTLNFSVQRSSDGAAWTEIGTVRAAGQSAQEKSYVFEDRTAAGSGVYRIVVYDVTGQSTISNIVKSSCSSRQGMSIYPNPSTGISSLNISLEQAARITVQVLDTRGALMQQRQIMLPSGNNTVSMNMTGYPQGVYTVNVRYDNKVNTVKLIIK